MIIDIIKNKRDKKELTVKELQFFANGVADLSITNYEISAFCMAVFLNGMSDKEVIELTKAYVKTGHVVKWGKNSSRIVDKHSTGGVGDKVTLALIPIIASLGLKCAKLSGKGLGKTGGTIDKLHSVTGFKTKLTDKEFHSLVTKTGMSIIEASKSLAPADKRVYAIRDVTGTVASAPLIAASIMSKKIAGGSKNLVIDLKLGSGAFMKTLKETVELAHLMKMIAVDVGVRLTVIITNMDQPLGFAIGNAIEVVEAYDVLNLSGPIDVTLLTMELAAELLLLTGEYKNKKLAIKKVKEVMVSKLPVTKFKEMLKEQGGDIGFLKDTASFQKAKYKVVIKAKRSGYMAWLDNNAIGLLTKDLGAGRINVADKLDYKAGIFSYTKVGDKISKGDTIFILQSSKKISKDIVEKTNKIYKLSKTQPKIQPLIYRIIK